jgi:predicted PurR-regulated permease PerM
LRFKWDKKYINWGITAFGVIACAIIFYLLLIRLGDIRGLLSRIFGVLSPIVIGIAVAYLLTPIMNYLEHCLFRKLAGKVFRSNEHKAAALSRALGIIVVLIMMISFIAGLFLMVIPQLIDSIEKLVINTDRYLSVARKWLEGRLLESPDLENTAISILDSTLSYIRSWLENDVLSKFDVIIANISSGVYSVIKAIFDFAVGIIVSVYVLYNKERFYAQSKKLLYSLVKVKRVKSLLDGFRFAHKMFGGFLLGKILSSLIVGVICAVFMLIMRMPYVALISALIAVTNIIPFVGPFIGGVPSAFLLLLESPAQCLIFIIFIIVLQFFEGNVLSAKILGYNTGLTGFWVIFAIFIGGMFGFLGMVVGVPLFAVLYHFLSNASRRRLRKRNLPTETKDYMSIAGPELTNISGEGDSDG